MYFIYMTNLEKFIIKTIDGLYGKNTEKGLKAYNQKTLGGLDLEKSDAVSQLIQKILE